MESKLEVIVVPVTDIDRALSFYADQLGFKLDHDIKVGESRRIAQLTPRGSGCSIVLDSVRFMIPGSLRGMQLTVSDLRAARAELLEHKVEVGEIQVLGGASPRPAEPGEELNHIGFLFFKDPDGNGWAMQQMPAQPSAHE